MKLTTSFFPDVIEITENEVFSLVIEHKNTFLKLLHDLYMQTDGSDGDVILSEKDAIIKISKSLELITSFVPFNLNEKRLLTRINSLLEKEALNGSNYHITMQLLADIERHISSLSNHMPYTISCQDLTASALIKMCNVRIEDDCISEIERVLLYMSIVNDLLGEKLFVFVNMTMFFSDLDMQGFIDTCNLHKYRVLLLDGVESTRFSGMRRLIIDKDLCTI